MQTQIRWCSGCQDDQVFEVALCDDGPADAHTELACSLCGLGVFDSVLIAIVGVVEHSARARTAVA